MKLDFRSLFLALLLATTAHAQVPISDLPAGAAITGTEEVPAVQSSVTVKTTPSALKTYTSSSPALTGTPTAPTAAVGTDTTQLATTAFVNGVLVDIQEFDANGTWTKPDGADRVRIFVIGSGGGGGGGAQVNSGTACSGGGGGGGASWAEGDFDADDLTSTVAVTAGVGGAGGTGAITPTSGGSGTAGAASSFGTYLYAQGGGLGNGGRPSAHSGGGGGGGSIFAGGNASGATAGTGGAVGGSNGGSNSDSVASTNKYGGGGGGGGTNAGEGKNGTGTLGSPSGGSSGGGLATTPADLAPGITGVWSTFTTTPGAGGDIALAFGTGTGGVGGSSSATVAGQDAGAGIRGSGGGGGGCGIGGGGDGGAGGNGYVLAISYFAGSIALNGLEPSELLRLYFVGNSLLNDSGPNNLPAYALASGFGLDNGYHIRFASSLGYIESNPTAASLVKQGLWNVALPLPHDAVVMQSYQMTGWDLLEEQTAFEDLAAISAGSPGFFLYQSWPAVADIGGAYQTYWAEAVVDADGTASINKKQFFDHLYTRLDGTIAEMYLVPIGDVFNQLDIDARAALIPGVATVADLYADGVHMGDIGRYAAGTTVIAVVGQVEPQEGAEELYRSGVGPTLTDDIAEHVRDVVWTIVTSDSRTGVGP
jgi:hypothetical protein